MDKTRVDDLIIQMITPKITEIEKKFSDGEGLTQDDINTLLLKSQYNHINHLDDKLNEVTNSVVMLENKFEIFTSKIELRLEQSNNKIIIVISSILTLFLGISQILEYIKA